MCNHDTYQSNSAKPEIIHNRGCCKLYVAKMIEFQIPFLCLLRRKSWFWGIWIWSQFVSQTGLKVVETASSSLVTWTSEFFRPYVWSRWDRGKLFECSAVVFCAHIELNNSKGSRRYSLREPFFFVSCVSVFILTFYSSLKNITFCVIIWLYNFLSHIWRVIASGISSRSGVLAHFSLGHTVLQKFKCSVRRLYKV